MKASVLAFFLAGWIVTGVFGNDKPKPPILILGTPSEQIEALLKQYDVEIAKYKLAAEQRRNSDDAKPLTPAPDRSTYCGLVLKIAKDHPKNPSRCSGLLWVYDRGSTEQRAEATAILTQDHLLDPQIGELCKAAMHPCVGHVVSSDALRTIMAKHPHLETRSLATFALAQRLLDTADKVRIANENPAKRDSYAPWYFDPADAERLKKLDGAAFEKEGCQLFERIIADPMQAAVNYQFCKEPNISKKLGEMAAQALFEFRYLQPGRSVPELIGEDIQGKLMKLSDFRGKVVVLKFGETWSDEIRKDMQTYNQIITDSYTNRGIVYIGVNVNRDRSILRQTAETEKVPWRSFWDGDKEQGTVSRQWHIPAGELGGFFGFVIDQRGIIVARLNQDERDRRKIDEAVRALKATKP